MMINWTSAPGVGSDDELSLFCRRNELRVLDHHIKRSSQGFDTICRHAGRRKQTRPICHPDRHKFEHLPVFVSRRKTRTSAERRAAQDALLRPTCTIGIIVLSLIQSGWRAFQLTEVGLGLNLVAFECEANVERAAIASNDREPRPQYVVQQSRMDVSLGSFARCANDDRLCSRSAKFCTLVSARTMITGLL